MTEQTVDDLKKGIRELGEAFENDTREFCDSAGKVALLAELKQVHTLTSGGYFWTMVFGWQAYREAVWYYTVPFILLALMSFAFAIAMTNRNKKRITRFIALEADYKSKLSELVRD